MQTIFDLSAKELNGVAKSFYTNLDSDNNAVSLTGIQAGYGLLFISCSTDGKAAIYRVDNQTLAAISADVVYNTNKDNASTYNVYYETDQFKIQNKVGNNKVLMAWWLGT